jgi:erythromycin esterase-like protein
VSTSRRRFATESTEAGPLLEHLGRACRPLGGPEDTDELLERIGDARYVLLGEASHGTSEYYAWRSAISQRLILEKDFDVIAVEGDWPDCYRINRHVRGFPDGAASAREVLGGFERWPTWMWANEEVAALVEWLREHNLGRPAARRVGFYGLDVYSLWESLYAILSYLQKHDPGSLPLARRAFRCFEPYGEDAQAYARATRFVPHSCEGAVVALLTQMRREARPAHDDGDETRFEAEQNAYALRNAEAYYRAMVRGGPDSWNIRDRHMVSTLERVVRHHGPRSKVIVWAHNTHIGDARFTDMAADGMVNLGQLVRETHSMSDVVLVGFGSYRGTVVAGREWEATPEVMHVPPARSGTWESLLHRVAGGETSQSDAGPGTRTLERAAAPSLFVRLADPPREMLEARGHRAIGVVYRPELEQFGNYVPTVLPLRYDAFLFMDQTRALQPLRARTDPARIPETFPSGM